MLILAEGTVHRPVEGDELAAVSAWLGPMVDAGFMQSGLINIVGDRVWILLSTTHIDSAKQRLADLPVARDGSVSFTVTKVTAMRFR
jgi:hypothetical protein